MHRIDGAGTTGDSKFTEGDPTQAVPATTVTAAWLNAVQEELAQAIEQLGLTLTTGDDTQLWQALQKVYGKTYAGNPNGNVAADVLRERCWDTSVSPPALYIATSADGTIGGTTWTRILGAASTTLRGQVELATNTETQTGTDSQRAVTPAGLASFDQSLGGDGYQKLPGGLILQWMTGSSRFGSETVDPGFVNTLPIAFPNVVLYASAIHKGGDADVNTIIQSASTSSIEVKHVGAASDASIFLFAIGR